MDTCVSNYLLCCFQHYTYNPSHCCIFMYVYMYVILVIPLHIVGGQKARVVFADISLMSPDIIILVSVISTCIHTYVYIVKHVCSFAFVITIILFCLSIEIHMYMLLL